MAIIHRSDRGQIRSVFNSEDDNFHYYQVLVQSVGTKISGLQFAEPRKSPNLEFIDWVVNGNIENFRCWTHFSSSQQEEIGRNLEKYYSDFRGQMETYKNAPENFVSKIIEIPNEKAIYVDQLDLGNIVIVEWGFNDDLRIRRQGVIRNLFPAPDVPVNVVLLNEYGNPIAGQEISLKSSKEHVNGKTDQFGRSRFGYVAKGTSINFEINGYGKWPEVFTVDGEVSEYVLRVDSINETSERLLTLRILDGFRRPISNFKLNFRDYGVTGPYSELISDSEGKIFFDADIEGKQIELVFDHKGEKWNYTLNSAQDGDDLIVKPIFPWFWWILNSTLFILLILCFIVGNCIFLCCDVSPSNRCCESGPEKVDSTGIEAPQIPCNSVTESGGKGVTRNHHILGSKGGEVTLYYNMSNQPDKLEVFDENGDLLASTSYITGNDMGFVGENNGSGCCGTLSFTYSPSEHVECIVQVTGREDSTIWKYQISCPDQEIENLIIQNNSLIQRPVTVPGTRNAVGLNPNPIPCDVQTASGGQGTTRNKHDMGSVAGTVYLEYNMDNMPDKLSVYDESGNILASTESIVGNEFGFVGGDNEAGATGTLRFDYVPSGNMKCFVEVIGREEGTVWQYVLSCPN